MWRNGSSGQTDYKATLYSDLSTLYVYGYGGARGFRFNWATCLQEYLNVNVPAGTCADLLFSPPVALRMACAKSLPRESQMATETLRSSPLVPFVRSLGREALGTLVSYTNRVVD